VDGPAHIRVKIEPGTLLPGEKGIIKLSYNGKVKNQYGFQTDNITIHTDDELHPDKSFSVFATLEDFSPPISPAESAKAPKLQITESTIDFGRIKQNQASVKEVKIVNLGKTSLQLRAIQTNCTCIVAESTDKVLKAGATTTIKISFNPQDRKGTQQKSITIYSSDPQNPVQRITLAAYVEG
jgi:ribosomal 50S subunit-recycling heat shock protein